LWPVSRLNQTYLRASFSTHLISLRFSEYANPSNLPTAVWMLRDVRYCAQGRDDVIRFGLLGCGRIAKRHSDLLGGNQIDQARLVAVCDPARARADAIASKFGVPASCDIDDFLSRKDIDVQL
jgi:hypothetical protein